MQDSNFNSTQGVWIEGSWMELTCWHLSMAKYSLVIHRDKDPLMIHVCEVIRELKAFEKAFWIKSFAG